MASERIVENVYSRRVLQVKVKGNWAGIILGFIGVASGIGFLLFDDFDPNSRHDRLARIKDYNLLCM